MVASVGNFVQASVGYVGGLLSNDTFGVPVKNALTKAFGVFQSVFSSISYSTTSSLFNYTGSVATLGLGLSLLSGHVVDAKGLLPWTISKVAGVALVLVSVAFAYQASTIST